MIKPKPKVCPYCKEPYTPFNSLNPCHLKPECATKWLRDNPEKAKKNRFKVERKELKDLKEKTLDRSHYMKLAQAAFNTFIRTRDKDLPCISCDNTRPVKYDAGHYFSVGAFPNLRFEELNCHKQCSKFCNVERSGNLHEYRPRLIIRIGQEKFDELEAMKRCEKHYSIDDLKEIIQTYRNKIKSLNQ